MMPKTNQKGMLYKSSKFKISVIGAVIIVAMLVFFLMRNSSPKEEKKEAIQSEVVVKRVIGIARIEPESKLATLSMKVSGIVDAIYKKEGEDVKKGDPILSLDASSEKANASLVRAKIATLTEQIKADQAAVLRAQVLADNAKKSFDRSQSLFESGVETGEQRDQREADYLSSKAEWNRLQANYETSKKKISELKSDLYLASIKIKEQTLFAPEDGTVLSIYVTLGEAVNMGLDIVEFAPQSPLSALVEVDELFADYVSVGQSAWVRAQGDTDKILSEGKVVFVSSYLKKKSIFSDVSTVLEDRRVREVRVRINPSDKLLYNARVECVIDVGGGSKK